MEAKKYGVHNEARKATRAFRLSEILESVKAMERISRIENPVEMVQVKRTYDYHSSKIKSAMYQWTATMQAAKRKVAQGKDDAE